MDSVVKQNRLNSVSTANEKYFPLGVVSQGPPTLGTAYPLKGRMMYNPSDGALYYADGTRWIKLLTSSNLVFNGDVVGPITNTVVQKINGQSFPSGTITGQVVEYDQVTNSWILNSITPPSEGDVLQYISGKWEPSPSPVTLSFGNVSATYNLIGGPNTWFFYTNIIPPNFITSWGVQIDAHWVTIGGRHLVDIRIYWTASQFDGISGYVGIEGNLIQEFSFLGIPLYTSLSQVPGGIVQSPPSANTNYPPNLNVKTTTNIGIQFVPNVTMVDFQNIEIFLLEPGTLTYNTLMNFSYAAYP